MLDKNKLTYDASTMKLVYDCGLKGTVLLPKEHGLELNRLAREGYYDGQPLQGVAVRFGDREAAEHNAGPLKFLGLASEHDEGVSHSGVHFAVRDDFGIE